MKRNLARTSAVALAVLGGSTGMAIASPVAAHAITRAPSDSNYVVHEPTVIIEFEDGEGCTWRLVVDDQNNYRVTVECVVVVQA